MRIDIGPLIEMSLESIHFEGSIGQVVGRQHRHSQPADTAEIALDVELAVARRIFITRITPMTVKGARTTARTPRTLLRECIFSNLDAAETSESARENNSLFFRLHEATSTDHCANAVVPPPPTNSRRYNSALDRRRSLPRAPDDRSAPSNPHSADHTSA